MRRPRHSQYASYGASVLVSCHTACAPRCAMPSGTVTTSCLPHTCFGRLVRPFVPSVMVSRSPRAILAHCKYMSSMVCLKSSKGAVPVRKKKQLRDEWNNDIDWQPSGYNGVGGFANGDDQRGPWADDDGESGYLFQPEHSLVGVSSTVTHHGVPLLSFTSTMNRFYTSRKQRLSLGRYRCEVCGERIRFWAWETEGGTRTHDGCYERLAWTWTRMYAQQQYLADQGQLD